MVMCRMKLCVSVWKLELDVAAFDSFENASSTFVKNVELAKVISIDSHKINKFHRENKTRQY